MNENLIIIPCPDSAGARKGAKGSGKHSVRAVFGYHNFGQPPCVKGCSGTITGNIVVKETLGYIYIYSRTENAKNIVNISPPQRPTLFPLQIYTRCNAKNSVEAASCLEAQMLGSTFLSQWKKCHHHHDHNDHNDHHDHHDHRDHHDHQGHHGRHDHHDYHDQHVHHVRRVHHDQQDDQDDQDDQRRSRRHHHHHHRHQDQDQGMVMPTARMLKPLNHLACIPLASALLPRLRWRKSSLGRRLFAWGGRGSLCHGGCTFGGDIYAVILSGGNSRCGDRIYSRYV